MVLALLGSALFVRPVEAASPNTYVQISARGLDFLAEAAARFVPKSFRVPTSRYTAVDCPLTDADTVASLDSGLVYVDVKSIKAAVVGTRVYVTVSMKTSGWAEVSLTRPYGCVGSTMNCIAKFKASEISTVVTFTPVVQDGVLKLADPVSYAYLEDDDLNFDFGSCGSMGTVADIFMSFAKSSLVKKLKSKLADGVKYQVLPKLNEMLAPFVGISGNVQGLNVGAKLDHVVSGEHGLRFGAELSVHASRAASCEQNPPPFLTGATTTMPLLKHREHASLGVSARSIAQAMRAIWKSGAFCLANERLRSLGLPHVFPDLASRMLGIDGSAPLSVYAPTAPIVSLIPGDGARLSLVIQKLELVIDAEGPQGPTTLKVEVDAEFKTRLGVDPTSRSVVIEEAAPRFYNIRLSASDADGLDLDHPLLAGAIGSLAGALVAARLRGMSLMPQILGGNTDGPLGDYSVYLARAETAVEGVRLFVDFFRTDLGVPPAVDGKGDQLPTEGELDELGGCSTAGQTRSNPWGLWLWLALLWGRTTVRRAR
jgi:hypothetical protein